MDTREGAEFFSAKIEEERLRILASSGQEAADMYMAAVDGIVKVNHASADLVECALRMANMATFEQMFSAPRGIVHSTGNGACITREWPERLSGENRK